MDISKFNTNDLNEVRQLYSQMRIVYEDNRKRFSRCVICAAIVKEFLVLATICISMAVLPHALSFFDSLYQIQHGIENFNSVFIGKIITLQNLIGSEDNDEVLKMAFLVFIFHYVFFVLSKNSVFKHFSKERWGKYFKEFAKKRFELLARMKILFGTEWELYYSTEMSPFEKPDLSISIPISLFGDDGKSNFLLGGPFSQLKPYRNPVSIQGQVRLYSHEDRALISFGDKHAAMNKVGKPEVMIEFDSYIRDEQPLYGDFAKKQRDRAERRWKRIGSIFFLSESKQKFMAKNEGRFIFWAAVAYLVFLAIYFYIKNR